MSGLNGVLEVSLSGVEAYNTALNTVSENISNATTPGYAQRAPLLVTRFDSGVADGAGTGVAVSGVERMTNAFADTRLRAALAEQGASQTLASAMNTLQGNFPSSGGIAGALGQFLSDASALATQPDNGPARQTLFADAQQLAGSFQQTANNISDGAKGSLTSAQALVQQVNQILGELGKINDQLRSGTTSNNGLLDNQSQLLQQLSGVLGFNLIRHGNGTVRLSVNGQVLLDQAGPHTVSLSTPPGQPPQLAVSGGQAIPASALSGQVGGTLAAVEQSQTLLQGLNRMAAVTAAAVNTQQALGLTPGGTQGQPLFAEPAPTVFANPVNTGSATLTATLQDADQLPTNGGPFTLRYTGSQWQAVNQANGKLQSLGDGTTLTFSGMTVTVSGTAAAGDTFTVNPIDGAASGMTVAASDPGAIASAVPYVATAGSVGPTGIVTDTNTGSASVGAGATAASSTGSIVVPAADFGQPLQLTFPSATTYQITNASGAVVSSGAYSAASGATIAVAYPAGSDAAGQFWTMPVSGAPAAGDTFTLQTGGPQSGGNADALGQLGTEAAVAGGLDGAWAQVTGAVGTMASIANSAQTNAATSVSNAQTAQQSISGVSLNAQAGQLQLYAQAYQASAQAIAAVGTLFQSLLSAVSVP
ncbi:MAG TPA: hypothetical protein VF292_15830 [Rhodanobacteraceae bacterium]